MSDPWMKFYTSDWRSDPRLKMCSPGARGMWIEMICLMHEATPYGHLLIHGQPPNEAQLASLTGIPSAELHDLVAELERFGVFSRTKEGVIYSRKLVRMASEAAKARKNGKRGGNPSLRKHDEKTGSLNPPDKDGDKPQKPDTRIQNPERKKESANALSKESASDPEGFDAFWQTYPHRGGAKKGRKPAVARYAAEIKAGTLPADILAGAERYRSDRQVLSGYAKDPTTWLNQKCWADDVEPQQTELPKAPTARLYDLTKYTG
jgi:hypothetical protein